MCDDAGAGLPVWLPVRPAPSSVLDSATLPRVTTAGALFVVRELGEPGQT